MKGFSEYIMEKRLKEYLLLIETFIKTQHSIDEYSDILSNLLIQISFFQHERLIHLLVTLAFAIITIACMIASLFTQSLPLFILIALLLILLIPYIRHYYILENGVQRLYKYYDEICKSMKTNN